MPYIDVESYYENTIMKEIRNDDGDLTGYDITPIDDYVLHNKALCSYEYDDETFKPIKLLKHGYSPSSCSVEPDYDFEANPDEIYAIRKDSIRKDETIY